MRQYTTFGYKIFLFFAYSSLLLFAVLCLLPMIHMRAVSFRKAYVWFFMITILFGGGLIPWYIVIKTTGLIDSIWALILPGAVPVFNMIILLNFFRNLPREIEEAAFIDGAGHWKTLWKIYVPLSVPALAIWIELREFLN